MHTLPRLNAGARVRARDACAHPCHGNLSGKHPQTGNPRFMISLKGEACPERATIYCHQSDCCEYKSKLKVQEAIIF